MEQSKMTLHKKMDQEKPRVSGEFLKKKKKFIGSKENKEEYVTRKGKAPAGPEYEAWLERKLGGDHSDSGYNRAFGPGGEGPLPKGEMSIPQKQYLKEKTPVVVGESQKSKDEAKKRIEKNQARTSRAVARIGRKEPDIESY